MCIDYCQLASFKAFKILASGYLQSISSWWQHNDTFWGCQQRCWISNYKLCQWNWRPILLFLPSEHGHLCCPLHLGMGGFTDSSFARVLMCKLRMFTSDLEIRCVLLKYRHVSSKVNPLLVLKNTILVSEWSEDIGPIASLMMKAWNKRLWPVSAFISPIRMNCTQTCQWCSKGMRSRWKPGVRDSGNDSSVNFPPSWIASAVPPWSEQLQIVRSVSRRQWGGANFVNHTHAHIG